MSMDEIVATYAESKEHIKKIILFEIIGLLFADGVFDQKEQAFLSKYAAEIGLDSYVVDKQIELMEKYLTVVHEIMDAMQ